MATSPIRGGKAIAAKLAEIADKAGKAGVLRVGFLEGATYPDGTSVAFVAAMNEYGHMAMGPDGPYFVLPRSFFRTMIAQKGQGWGPKLGRIAVATGYDMEKTLMLMGEGIKGQLQESIQQFDSVPLAESTIKRKGFDKQLVDSGHMQNSVDYQVVMDE